MTKELLPGLGGALREALKVGDEVSVLGTVVEVRKALETRIVNLKANLEHWKDINARLQRGETVNVMMSNENYHGDEISFLEKILDALAPSRQGAGEQGLKEYWDREYRKQEMPEGKS